MLLNKATLLDPHLKSLAHLTEEQEATVNSIVDEIVFGCLQSTPTAASESNHSAESSNDSNHPPPTKKCALEKLLGDTFSSNRESSLSVSLNDLVLAELSRYKSEPILEVKEKPMEWWRSHHPSYPHLAKMARKYLGVVATSVPSDFLVWPASSMQSDQHLMQKTKHLFLYMIIFQLCLFLTKEFTIECITVLCIIHDPFVTLIKATVNWLTDSYW